jgi:hypothetical protein
MPTVAVSSRHLILNFKEQLFAECDKNEAWAGVDR